ncbi:MAG: hypothetical protein R3F35_18965 [Myxococcota bacterium]
MGEGPNRRRRGTSARAEAGGIARGQRSPMLAAVLAILLPGAGHLYARRLRAAAAWLAAILLGYWAVFLPGAVLHAISVWSAYRAALAPAPPPTP